MTLDHWNILITGVALMLALLIAWYSWRHVRALSVSVVVWFALALVFSLQGFFQTPSGWADGDMVGFLIFGTLMSLPLIGLALGWMRSARLRDFLTSIPLPALMGIQVYRVAGAIFGWMYLQAMMPPELGIFTGFADIFIGVTAVPLAWAVARGMTGARRIALAWNLFGISDFVIAVGMVSLSLFGLVTMTPDPVRIGLHPLALIALFQLPLSIVIHVLALRQLITKEKALAWQPS